MKTIFIASAPRSGSTWFSNLFNSHPDVVYRHEPLGRLKGFSKTELFQKLKYNHGLNSQERQELIEILLQAVPDVDRPPFFNKSYSSINPKLQHLLWAGAMKFGLCKSFFEYLNTPNYSQPLTLVVKETGVGIHLSSILAGMVPDHTIFLLRHPCAIISSIKDGITKGLMNKQVSLERARWYGSHEDNAFLKAQNFHESDIQGLSNLEFWAVKIRVLYDLILEVKANQDERVSLVVYEDVQARTIEELEKVFSRLWINLDPSVYEFVNRSTKQDKKSLLLPESSSEYYSVRRNSDFDPAKWKVKLSRSEISMIETIIGQKILKQFWMESETSSK